MKSEKCCLPHTLNNAFCIFSTLLSQNFPWEGCLRVVIKQQSQKDNQSSFHYKCHFLIYCWYEKKHYYQRIIKPKLFHEEKLEKRYFVRSGIRTHAHIRGPECSLLCSEESISWVWRLRPLGHPDILVYQQNSYVYQFQGKQFHPTLLLTWYCKNQCLIVLLAIIMVS